MARLDRRLQALEEQAGLRESHTYSPDGGEFQRWQARARLDRQKRTDAGRTRCRDLICLFRTQHILQNMSAEDVIRRILDWQPPLEDLTHSLVEREVARAIFAKEPGTEDMMCPECWRESLEAGAELLKRYQAIPDHELAEWWSRTAVDHSDEKAVEGWYEALATRYGITDELCMRAIGPDADEIDEDEAALRLEEYLIPVLEGDKGWRIHRLSKEHKEMLEEPRGAYRRSRSEF